MIERKSNAMNANKPDPNATPICALWLPPQSPRVAAIMEAITIA